MACQQEPEHANAIHALGHSVSFGRFTSQSLDWGKWSVFSQNRYVEEAEQFSRPGTVAQKKAFFESQYKNRMASKSEIKNEAENAISDTSKNNENHSHDIETQVLEAISCNQVHELIILSKSSREEEFSDNGVLKEDGGGTDCNDKGFADVEIMVKTPVKIISDRDRLSTKKGRNKPSLGSTKSSYIDYKTDAAVSHCVKQRNSVAPSVAKVSRTDSAFNLLSSSRQNQRPVNGSTDHSGSKETMASSTTRSHVTVSKVVKPLCHLSTSGPEERDCRPRTPLRVSSSGNKTRCPPGHILPTGTKVPHQSACQPFTFRTAERAARRKELLKEKLKTEFQASQQEFVGSESRQSSQAHCFKARPLPKFYKQAEKRSENDKVHHRHHEAPVTTLSVMARDMAHCWNTANNKKSKQAPEMRPISHLLKTR